jgi:hypothetical protein
MIYIFTSEDRENISLCSFSTHSLLYNYHLFTETEGNSVFCGPETTATTAAEGPQNTLLYRGLSK